MRGAYSWSISLIIVASADVMLSRSWKYVAFADASPHDDAAYAMRWWPNPMRIVPTTSAPSFGGVNGSAPVGLSSNIGIRPVTRSPETYGDGASESACTAAGLDAAGHSRKTPPQLRRWRKATVAFCASVAFVGKYASSLKRLVRVAAVYSDAKYEVSRCSAPIAPMKIETPVCSTSHTSGGPLSPGTCSRP